MKKINVILSGGVGSRLWPLSRKKRPKQYLPLFEGETLFQKTVKRNMLFSDQVMIVGNAENYQLSRIELQLAGFSDYTEIIEACPRNTAAAIAFAALSAEPSDILFVTPSDHLIEGGDTYRKAVERAFSLAGDGFIVTFGLKPTHADTGFGYIESKGEDVLSFREKPDLTTATEFLKQGNFFWNSGMFCFQVKVFLEELKRFEPEIFEASKSAWILAKEGKMGLEESLKIPSKSVDYAVMERSKLVKVVPSFFSWSDLGSFESIYSYFKDRGHPIDPEGNMVIGTALHTEFSGMKNTLLIQTEDAILVLQREESQQVKKIYERLEKEKPQLV